MNTWIITGNNAGYVYTGPIPDGWVGATARPDLTGPI